MGGASIRLTNVGATEHYAKFFENGAVELYYDNSKKLETTTSGVTVTGNVNASSFIKSGGTSSQFLMADGSVNNNSAQIVPSTSGNRWGVNGFIASDGVMEVGQYIDFHNSDSDTSDYSLRITANGTIATFSDGASFGGQVTVPATPSASTDAASKGYVDSQVGANNELSEVLANGNTTGGTDISVSSGDDITFADSSKSIYGADSDLQIYSDGTVGYIKGNDVRLVNSLGENIFRVNGDAAELYYNDRDWET